MDKNKVLNYVLAGLPMIAVVLAGMGNSVTIYPSATVEPVYCSYFTLVEDVTGAICLPLAALCGAVAFGLAVLYLVKHARTLLMAVACVSFAAATLAVVPILARGEILVIPNMLVPILLLAECVMAYGMFKAPQEEQPKMKGRRL